MSEETTETRSAEAEDPGSERVISVSPGPHLLDQGHTTRRMMIDVLLGLAPVVLAALWLFRWGALMQLVVCGVGCMAAEAIFTRMRGQALRLHDCSALVTGVILGLSLPSTASWYIGLIASFVAIGLGKIVFGGVGANLFNPAMVGRAFVMIAFPASLGASAYVLADGGVHGITMATPLTVMKQGGEAPTLLALFLGNVNGSPGETSALACMIGGAYLLIRRTASWEIPLGLILAVLAIGGIADLSGEPTSWSALHHCFSGALLFGAFFIATDPVSSPLTPRGKFIFGLGTGALVMLLRGLSGYPEGVMFAVLLMNSVVPLINRWTIPTPVGGPVQAEGSKV